MMIGRTALLLVLTNGAVHLATALKIEAVRTTDLEKEFVALHVKLHSTVVGLKQQLKQHSREMRKAAESPMILKFQRVLERILSDTVHMKDRGAALAELRSADGSVNRLITPYKTWEAANRSYKLAPDTGILLEADNTASSLNTQLSKMEKAFQAKQKQHEKRSQAFRLCVSASATKSNKDALEREDETFNKLSNERSTQFAEMRSAVDAVKRRDPIFLFSFVRTVHDATVNDDSHAEATD